MQINYGVVTTVCQQGFLSSKYLVSRREKRAINLNTCDLILKKTQQ